MDIELKRAVELAKNGDWHAAHELVQRRSDENSCWIHAYLHRVEGDHGNARYWYQRAGQPFPDVSPEQEIEQLTRLFASEEP